MKNQRGQSVTEYGILLVIIVTIMVSVVRLIGSGTASVFSQIVSKIQ